MAAADTRERPQATDADSRSDLATSQPPDGPGQVEREPASADRIGSEPGLRGDPEIRDEIAAWLASQETFDPRPLQVLVEQGIVMLLGKVAEYESKRRIEQFVIRVRGVREVHDQLLVTRDDLPS